MATLIGADFTGAKLRRAKLSGAQIHNAIFTGVIDLETVQGFEDTEGRNTATVDR